MNGPLTNGLYVVFRRPGLTLRFDNLGDGIVISNKIGLRSFFWPASQICILQMQRRCPVAFAEETSRVDGFIVRYLAAAYVSPVIAS